MKILVADGSEIMRKLLTRGLDAIDLKDVIEASHHRSAIEAIKNQSIDLAFVDWQMHETSGAELLLEMRAIHTQVHIVVLARSSQRGQMLQAMRAGADDYLIKPFDESDLHVKVEKFAGALRRP